MGELDGSFDARGVVGDRLIHIFAALEESLLVFIRGTEGPVEALILGPESVHRLFPDHLIEHSLEVLLEFIITGCIHA